MTNVASTLERAGRCANTEPALTGDPSMSRNQRLPPVYQLLPIQALRVSRSEVAVKNLILMTRQKAERLTDKELDDEISQLESGKKKLRLRDERGRLVPLNALILPVLRREKVQRTRKEKRNAK